MNRVTKIAAALAATFLLIGGGVSLFLTFGGPGAKTALADVVKELNVHTARFIMTSSIDPPVEGAPAGQKMEVFWMEPSLMRCNMPSGQYTVMDQKAGRMIFFMPDQKKVMVIAMKGQFKTSAGPGKITVTVNDKPDDNDFFGRLREKVTAFRSSRAEDVEALGEKIINGRRAIGFHKAHDEGIGDLELWADVETHMPALVIMSLGNSPRTTITMTDFQFDVPLDPALFSTEIPPGFTVDERTIDASPPTEAEFVAGLGKWAELMDGAFPPALDASALQDALGKMAGRIAKDAATKMAELQKPPAMKPLPSSTHFSIRPPSAQKPPAMKPVPSPDAGNPPSEEAAVTVTGITEVGSGTVLLQRGVETPVDAPAEEKSATVSGTMVVREDGSSEPIATPEMPSQEVFNEAMRFQRVVMFVMQLTNEKIDWHYAGKGVRLGDAATPIFWYRPAGSATYRVVSGALDVSDAAPDALPK